MEVRNSKYPAYKKIMKNNFMNQYYHSASVQNEDSKPSTSNKGV